MNERTFRDVLDFLGRIAKSQSKYSDEAMALFSQVIAGIHQMDYEEHKNNPIQPDVTERMK